MSVSTRAERGTAAAVSVAASFGLTVEHPVVLRSLATIVVRLEPHPVVARAHVPGPEALRPGSLGRALREAHVLQHLSQCGAPTVPVSPLLPPGPHLRDGIPVVTFARVAHDPRQSLDGSALALSLQRVRRALATYPGLLPAFPHLDDAAAWMERSEFLQALSVPARRRMAAVLAEPRTAVADAHAVALHGDAHSGNALLGPGGTVCWADLEDVCRGPAEWDLACLVATARIFGGDRQMARDALAAWGFCDPDLVDTLVLARGVQVVAWGLLTAGAQPARARAAFRRADALLEYLP